MDLQKINSKDILENVKVENEMFSLTDLWKLAGSDPQRTPAKWQESEPVQRFLQTACKFLNVGISDIIKSKRGKGGGTWGYRNCTNAIYENLYGGSSTVVREKKVLTSKEKIRDNMSSVELQSVMLAELLAANAINENDIRGNAKCEMTTRKASASVKKSLLDFKRSISNQNNF